VAHLPEADHAEGSLALLAAVAPRQIDAEIIQELRAEPGTDARLVGVVAWASFQAARRILSWLQIPAQRLEDSQRKHALGQSD
jgi:hypothetical protein